FIVTGLVEAAAFFQRRSRVWCADLGEGLEVRELGEAHTFADADVMAMALWDKKIYNNGKPAGVRRNVRYWLYERETPVVMNYRIKEDQTDPLAELHNRLLDLLEQRASEALDQGQHAAGEGWAVSSDSLATGASTDSLVPFDQLAAVDVFGDEVCIWRTEDEHASIRIPIKSRNSYLLIRLLSKRIPERDPSATPTGGLGRVLFERKSEFGLLALVLAILFTLLSTLLFLVHPLLGFAAPLAVTAISVFYYFYCKKTAFRCHEMGVYDAGLFGEKKLRYEEVQSFTYSATRMYVNGAYTGTQTQLEFVPRDEVGGAKISYHANIQGADDDLDALRNHVSQVISAVILKEIADGRSIAWTPNLTFHNEHLEFVPSSFFGGKKPPITLPWNKIQNFDIQEGTFHVWEQGVDKSVIHEPVASPNFFPGFHAFCAILTPATESEEELVEAGE
ncbi:MAG: hypothetical protein ACIALR_14725, partial [Blastopirellula sp. JB062]